MREYSDTTDFWCADTGKIGSAPIGQVVLCLADLRDFMFLWKTQHVAMRAAVKANNSVMHRLLRNWGENRRRHFHGLLLVRLFRTTLVFSCADEVAASRLATGDSRLRRWSEDHCIRQPERRPLPWAFPTQEHPLMSEHGPGQICISSNVVRSWRTSHLVRMGWWRTQAGGIRERKWSLKIGFTLVAIGDRKLNSLETFKTLPHIYPKALTGRIEHDKLIS
ncbi:hypothetical protein BC938DRAFT_472380 [Jimgerdemannia flammicorona]|uniref:Guanylate cyclase domain-containing protein n=1 Tax=Jimgerdemannia flammicorona TaxID=994334 RepID=A0A433Q668_9FUNG|nr:hypothetical protein BC938DRAFT_472380 [Jimgerdemannia flammicorona]